jgi:hypothetical protein
MIGAKADDSGGFMSDLVFNGGVFYWVVKKKGGS